MFRVKSKMNAFVLSVCVSVCCMCMAAGDDGIIIQAHRAAQGEYDDNALGGIEWCLSKGVRGFELDFRFTKDRKVIAMHDRTLDRTTDGTGVVEETLFEDVRKLRLKASGERVPTAIEMFSALKGRPNTFLEIEMKAYPGEFYTDEVLEDYCRKLYAAAKACLHPGTYVFTCFNTNTLAVLKRAHPDAEICWLTGELTAAHVETAKAMGCVGVAPHMKYARKDAVEKARKAGLKVTLWMVDTLEDYAKAKELGADRITSNYPHLLRTGLDGRRKKVVAIDVEAFLCRNSLPPRKTHMDLLTKLQERYRCVMVGSDPAEGIYHMLAKRDIDIIGNYGMEVLKVTNGKFRRIRTVTNKIDRAAITAKAAVLRKCYGYEKFTGESLRFNRSGMVSLELLGTKGPWYDQLKFDVDRAKRRALYPDAVSMFSEYTVYIRGTTEIDLVDPRFDKYRALVDWAAENGYSMDEIIYIGSDYLDGEDDAPIRKNGVDRLVMPNSDYKFFPRIAAVLF